MNAEGRKRKILDILNKEGSVNVSSLSRKFAISEVTIRKDLADMEFKGLLTRTHGGAVSSYKPYYSLSLNQRMTTNQAAKTVIAKKIAQKIEHNDTVMLNSGTTTLIIFRALPPNLNLNIITNSVSIALEGAGNPNFNIILIGGFINAKYQFTYGDDAIRQIKNYHADKAVLSVDGVDSKNGYSTYYDREAEIDRVMLAQSDLKIIAADFSKFHKTAFSKIADINAADYIITNKELPYDKDDILFSKCMF